MPYEGKFQSNRTLIICGVLTVIATLVVGALILRRQPGTTTPPASSARPAGTPVSPAAPGADEGKLTLKVKQETVVDYNIVSEDPALSSLMAERKAKYRVDKGVDLIVRSDETLKVGVTTIRMKEVLDTIRLERGELLEADIEAPDSAGRSFTAGAAHGSHAPAPVDGSPGVDSEGMPLAIEYGIHVVQPGENIWNIHFTLLREYLGKKGIAIASKSDEPEGGRSTGVGKLLKFSEKMVAIYNIVDRRLATDINLIRPETKLVVYNMKEIFKLIEQIETTDIDRIWFDGDTIWIPTS